MPDTIVKGYGAALQVGSGSTYTESSTWATVAQVNEIEPPNVEADDIDTSHLLSPDYARTFSAGWVDAGEITLTAQYTPDGAEALYELLREDKGFRIAFADGSGWGCDGYIKSFGTPIDADGLVTCEVVIKVSGLPTMLDNIDISDDSELTIGSD